MVKRDQGISGTPCDSPTNSFLLVDNELFTSDGTGQFSTSDGVPYAPFVASTNVGDITTSFTANGTTLTWGNAAFTGGEASFCMLNGSLYAVFTTVPAGCTMMQVGVQDCDRPNGTTTGSSTGAAGGGIGQSTSGPSGVAGGNSNSGLPVSPTGTIPGNTGSSTIPSIAANITSHCSQEVLDLVPEIVIEGFGSGDINYYCGHTDYYFARFCPVCDIVKVDIEHDTIVYVPCPVCPAVKEQCPGKTAIGTSPAVAQKGSSQPASAGNYQYEPPVCPTCSTITALNKVPLTTITVACPTCSGGSEGIACPTAAASSLASLAKASGAPACEKAAAAAIESAEVAALTATAPSGATATSTVVNVPCSACAAGSRAVAVPQVAAATPAGPAATAASQPTSTGLSSGNAGASAKEGAVKYANPNVGGNASLAPGGPGGFNNLSSNIGAANASNNEGVVQALRSGILFISPIWPFLDRS